MAGVVTAVGNGVAIGFGIDERQTADQRQRRRAGHAKALRQRQSEQCMLAVAELTNWTPNPWGTGQLYYRIYARSLGSSIYHNEQYDGAPC
jgi:hypothetical protein